MASKRDRDIEKVYTTRQFVAKLRRLADALEAGEPFAIQVAGESIRVPRNAVFNVEHEREGEEEEIEFQLKWRRPSVRPISLAKPTVASSSLPPKRRSPNERQRRSRS